MAPVLIPEGFVFVPRIKGENVAAALFESVERVKADRYTSVRTTTGGYHVQEDVAEDYQAHYGQSDGADESTEDSGAPAGDSGQAAADSGQPAGDDGKVKDEETPGVTDANTRDEIDEFASKLDPAVDTTKAPNKGAALKMIEDALAQKSTPAA